MWESTWMNEMGCNRSVWGEKDTCERYMHMWCMIIGEAQWGDSVLCDDGCPFTTLLLHHNEHIHMTTVCWFSVLSVLAHTFFFFSPLPWLSWIIRRTWDGESGAGLSWSFSCSFISVWKVGCHAAGALLDLVWMCSLWLCAWVCNLWLCLTLCLWNI